MTRAEAIEMFGGAVPLAAAIGVDRSRISQWPAEGDIAQRDADRVMGAALRLGLLRLKADGGEHLVIT